jgi:hypothetical protein
MPFAPEEANRLRTWLLLGGSLFAAIGPVEADTGSGMAPAGIAVALDPFGIALEDDFVHDLEPNVAIPDTHGEGFLVTPRPHPVTSALVPSGTDAHPPRVAMFFARSLRHTSSPGSAAAVDLLVTSSAAFSKKSVVGASEWKGAPVHDATDATGPFAVAMASERPAPVPGGARGPRVVVVASRFAFAEDNWLQPGPLHGMAFFVDSAFSWLAARPGVVDVPERPEVAAGVRVSEASRAEVRRYAVVFMPLAALLLGAAVWAWRRSLENAPRAHEPTKTDHEERSP